MQPKIMAIEVSKLVITQTEDDPTAAEVTLGALVVRMEEAELHDLFAKLDMFMTNLNYQRNGWARPYLNEG